MLVRSLADPRPARATPAAPRARRAGTPLEGVPHGAGADLGAGVLGDGLDGLGELDLEPARKVEAVLGLHDVGDAALAALAVHPDDGLVGAADVLGVDGEVGHLPHVVVALPPPSRRQQRVHALLDGVLVGAGERGVHEVADVGVPQWTGRRLQYSAMRRRPSMSLMSSTGSTPWLNRFMASVTTSTLPVRSPLPNSVPSTRSAPAITPSSAAATAQPRSLWGCSDRHTLRGCGRTGGTTRSRRRRRWACTSRPLPAGS